MTRRQLFAAAATAGALLGTGLGFGYNAVTDEKITPAIVCHIVLPSTDSDPTGVAWRRLTDRVGTLDYDGGRVYVVSSGETIGQAATEDSAVYDKRECI